MKLVIGLLGGIGSGKSRVATEFERLGAFVIRADQLGHEALRQPEIRDALVRRWGPEILDDRGEVIRQRVGRIVFSSEPDRKALEALVHPYIGLRIQEEIARARENPAVR